MLSSPRTLAHSLNFLPPFAADAEGVFPKLRVKPPQRNKGEYETQYGIPTPKELTV